MSLEEFVEETLRRNPKELEEIRELEEILRQLNPETTRVYAITVTSNL